MEQDDRAVAGPPNARAAMLRWVARYRYLFLTVLVLAVLAASFVNHYFPPLYSASVLVYLDQPSSAQGGNTGMEVVAGEAERTLYHEAVSHERLMRLAQRLDLGRHYGLPDSMEGRVHWMMEILRARVDVRMSEQRSMKITVWDPDRDMAVRLARDLFLDLRVAVERRAHDDHHRRARFFQELANDMEKQMERERSTLTELASAFGTRSVSDGSLTEIIEMTGASSRLSGGSMELIKLRRAQLEAFLSASKDNLPRLLLIRDASPDHSTKPIRIALLRVLGAALLGLFLSALALLYWERRREEFSFGVVELFSPEPRQPAVEQPFPQVSLDAVNGYRVDHPREASMMDTR